MNTRLLALAWLAASALCPLSAAHAQAGAGEPQPMPSAMTPPIADPQDTAYPGQIELKVDLTDIQRRIYTIHETIPVAQAGPMVLLYPQWLPGNHSPSGPLDQLGSLVVTAGGQRVAWTRDPVNVYAFHVDAPQGATSLQVDYQYFAPTDAKVGHVSTTPRMLDLEWNSVVLYPAGHFSRDITYRPSVTLPQGWSFATALDGAQRGGDVVSFAPVTLNTLVDSPMIAGRYFKSMTLSTDPVPVRLNVLGDRPEDLVMTPEEVEAHKNLVTQAYRLYGSHHYDHYDFLLWVSDDMGGQGLEHHRSSEDGVGHDYFSDWSASMPERDLLAHEYTHSWNGKFRRPADLWTANFNVPMRDSLLWVYEGQTQYWGNNLAARSGLWTKQDALDAYAETAATYGTRIGAEWRPLEDTTNDPIIAQRRPLSWRSWQRSEDYYSNGQLIWLSADTLIRQKTGNRKSLDNFAREFFGVRNGSYVTDTYTFDDVVAALNKVMPYDWATFLKTRLDETGQPGARLDGITQGGYRLIYNDVQTPYFKGAEKLRKSTDLSFSIGLVLDKDGKITDVHWDGPAYKAGLTVGGQIVAVNGRGYDGDELKDAIKAAEHGGPLNLTVKTGDYVQSFQIAWTGGLRYPHLERISGTPDYLGDILTAKK